MKINEISGRRIHVKPQYIYVPDDANLRKSKLRAFKDNLITTEINW